MLVTEAIERANAVLPGEPAPDGVEDPRWQAIIEIATYIDSHPEEVWQFAHHWGNCSQEDVRDAIACCLLEHLLEHHWQLLFPQVAQAAKEEPLLADTVSRCWKFGQSADVANAAEFDRLIAWCRASRRR